MSPRLICAFIITQFPTISFTPGVIVAGVATSWAFNAGASEIASSLVTGAERESEVTTDTSEDGLSDWTAWITGLPLEEPYCCLSSQWIPAQPSPIPATKASALVLMGIAN